MVRHIWSTIWYCSADEGGITECIYNPFWLWNNARTRINEAQLLCAKIAVKRARIPNTRVRCLTQIPIQSEISSRIQLATAYSGYECRYSCMEKGYPENFTPQELTDDFPFRKRCRLRNVPREPAWPSEEAATSCRNHQPTPANVGQSNVSFLTRSIYGRF